MERRLRPIVRMAAWGALGLIFACSSGGSGDGDGGGGGNQQTNTGGAEVPNDPPPPAVAAAPRGVPILLVAKSKDTSTYTSGGRVESSTQWIYRYVPSTGDVAEVDTNHSVEWAGWTSIEPYTVDDRLFVAETYWDDRTVNMRGALREYDPDDLEPAAAAGPDGTWDGCYAMLGDVAWYKSGGALWRRDLSDSGDPGRVVLEPGHADRCRGNLGTADGKLFDGEKHGDQLDLYQRDTDDGRFIHQVSFTYYDDADYRPFYDIAFEGRFAWWARVRESDGQVEIWRYPIFQGTSAPPRRVYSAVIHGAEDVVGIDADDGVVAVHLRTQAEVYGAASDDRYVLLYDDVASRGQLLDLGEDYYNVQLLVLQP